MKSEKVKKVGQRIYVKADKGLGTPATRGTIKAVDMVNRWYSVLCDDDNEECDVHFDGSIVVGPF